jgi:hypothetical protein
MPPQHDYEPNRSFDYLEGRGVHGRAGAIMLGRGAVPLPAPFAGQNDLSGHQPRGGPSTTHNKSLTPWRDPEEWNKHPSFHQEPSTASLGPDEEELARRKFGMGDQVRHGPSVDHERVKTPWREMGPAFWTVPKEHVPRMTDDKSWSTKGDGRLKPGEQRSDLSVGRLSMGSDQHKRCPGQEAVREHKRMQREFMARKRGGGRRPNTSDGATRGSAVLSLCTTRSSALYQVR